MTTKSTTLIEMVVGIIITAILSLTVIVSFSLIDRRNLETSARNLVYDLFWVREAAISQARDVASSHRHEYIVTFDSVLDSYSIYEDLDDDEVADANELVSRVKLQANLVSLTDTGGTPIAPARIIFTLPYGQIKDSSGTTQDMILNLSRAGKTKQVGIFAATSYFRLL